MKKTETSLTPTERFHARQAAAILVRQAVRKIGKGGIETVAGRLLVSAPSVRQWTAGTQLPSFTMAERIQLVLGREGGAA